jgi:hypothetical protein
MNITDTACGGIVTRRTLCLCGAAAALAVVIGAPRVRAAGSGATRAAAWVIGSNLAFAGMLYAQGADAATVDSFLAKAKGIAESDEIGIEIKPFPDKGGSMPETMAVVIHYLIQGDGWNVGQALSDKFDAYHGTLFEVAVKSSLLLVLYQPGDDSGIGEIIRDRCQSLDLPPELWTPVTDAIAAQKDSDTIRDAVLKMHDDMSAFLLKDAG